MYAVQRRSPRIDSHGDVSIASRFLKFNAALTNMSLHGILVRADKGIPVGEPAVLTFRDPEASRLGSIRVNAVVVRNDETGVAFDITRMDVDTLILLRSMLKYSA